MKDRAISLQIIDAANKPHNFSTLRSFYDFAISERDFWQSQVDRVNQKPRHSHNYIHAGGMFGTIISNIDNWKENQDQWDDQQLNQNLSQLRQSYLGNLQNQWLWSGHEFVEPFIQSVLSGGERTGQAFLDYVIKKNVQNVQNIESYTGYLYAYEFVNQESPITKRRNGEKTSLNLLRNQFSEARDKLFGEADKLKQEFIDWDKENRAEAEKLLADQKLAGETQIAGQDKQFDEQLRTWSKTINELENAYQEKLRLEKPAEYWNKAARKFGIQGGLWSLAIVALAIFGLVNFHEVFVNWLQGKQIGLQFNTVQGVILFGSIAAIYAFLMRVLSRLAFSSFHLMRDAEEREQLTYLYLALTNQSAVDEKSRDIVLQALFSRSETGLLAQEHGPTMPGIGEVINAASKARG